MEQLDPHQTLVTGSTQPPQIKQIIPRKKKQRKVLLLSDSHGRSISSKLPGNLGDGYQVTSFVKQNAGIQEVVKSIDTLTAYFTSDDLVTVLSGTNDTKKRLTHK